jgi:uncharacterized delta-60 repeat protein
MRKANRGRFGIGAPALAAAALLSLAGAGVFLACVGDEAAPPSRDAGGDVTTAPDGGGNADGGGNDGGGAADASLATLALTPARPLVRQGASAQVEVSVTRNGVAGDLTVTLTGLPNGVSAQPATIAANATTTNLTLTATGAAAVGDAPITVKATGAADLATTLTVAGAPGALDTSFDGDGYVIDSTATAGAYYAVAVQPDGKILVAGTTNTGGGAWLVKRFGADGAPDTAFNTAAAAVVPTTGAARAIALDPQNGRVVVAGGSNSPERLTIVRLSSSGAADQGFANAGTMLVSTVDHGNGSRGNALVVLPNSDIVVAGIFNVSAALAHVEKYTAAGVRDPNFVTYTAANASTFTGLWLLSTGAFLATGTDVNASPNAQLAVRLLSNGTPDAAFGTQGVRTYTSGCRGYASALAANGDVVIAGNDQTAPAMCVTRIAASAAGAQVFTQSLAAGSGAQYTAAARGPGDTAYTAGYVSGSQDYQTVIERRSADGGLDTTFFPDAGKLVLKDIATPDTYRYLPQAATTANGRLIVVGQRTVTNTGPFILRVWE